MDKISTTKRAVQHKAWTEMYAAYQASGKTTREWCSEQGIAIKTFYYRLRMLREEALDQVGSHQIVPITANLETSSVHETASIKIQGNGITVEFPENIAPETITAILRGLR